MKIGYSEKEIGRMTYAKFIQLYEAYKRVFDLEMMMTIKGITYTKIDDKDLDEVIPI